MQFIMELWIPILVGGLAVFVMSALVWTVLPHHRKEWRKLPNEEQVADAIRAGNVTPGLYHLPHMNDMKEMGSPEGIAKMNRGPLVYMTVAPTGMPTMGPMMAKSAIASIIIATFVAYVAWHSLPAGSEYLQVFRIVSAVGFMTYCLGSIPESIWFARPWSSFFLQAFDALLYGLVLGGVFGWLWI
ncbi:MAG TPA: hypothetical protein VM820_20810 [Vicinamibacterales bacterium]|jgi:hypothetical protein|nr:hypothetical protein [Vicinamibacterales bacterium]